MDRHPRNLGGRLLHAIRIDQHTHCRGHTPVESRIAASHGARGIPRALLVLGSIAAGKPTTANGPAMRADRGQTTQSRVPAGPSAPPACSTGFLTRIDPESSGSQMQALERHTDDSAQRTTFFGNQFVEQEDSTMKVLANKWYCLAKGS